MLVDGERRFWAYAWLDFMGACGDSCVVPCRVLDEPPQGDLRAIQWSSSTQRQDLCSIDIGYWISMRFDQIQRNIGGGVQPETATVSSQMLLDEPDTAAFVLVGDELRRMCGREFSLRSLRRYRQWVRTLSPESLRLAAAFQAGARVLDRVVRVKDPQRQLRSLRIELGLEAAQQRTAKGGRPSRIERCRNLYMNAAEAFDKLSDDVLDAVQSDQMQTVLAEIESVHERLAAHVGRLKRRAGLRQQ